MSEPSRKLAVALRYDAPDAPRVVAAGRGLLGQRIIETAQAHGVPIERNPGLAQALAGVELNAEIPAQLYMAVAEILAFLLRASQDDKEKKEEGEPQP